MTNGSAHAARAGLFPANSAPAIEAAAADTAGPADAPGLGPGPGGDAVKSIDKPEQPAPGAAKRLPIKAKC